MRTLKSIMMWMVILPFLFVMSCKDSVDDPIPDDDFGTLTEYLVSGNMDLPQVLNDWIKPRPATADEVPDFLSARYVMDIRSATDFDKGHVEGAVNSSLATIVADAASAGGKQILVVCYTGQSASHATVALRLSGFANAQVLKWGMSGWTGEDGYDNWTPNTSSGAMGDPNWTMVGTAALQDYNYPTFNATATTGAGILAERVQYMVEKGFQGVPSTDVYGTPANYHINNFWDQASIDKYGNINTAYKINPLTLAGGEFKHYDPTATNVTYCWTGQTSSMVTAYLTVLGYNAKSLKFGVNSMIYDDLNDHKWFPILVDYPVVTD